MSTMTTRQRIQLLTLHSMIIALIALMGFIPFLGFIPLGAGVSITIMHLPVLLGAVLLNPKSATLFGFTFGVVSLLVVLTNPTPQPTDLFFINPLISVLPRILFGLIAGVVFLFAKKVKGPLQLVTLSGAALIATILHTILVLTMLWLFEGAAFVETFGNIINFIGFILGLNGLIEAVLAAIIIPTLYVALHQVPLIRNLQETTL